MDRASPTVVHTQAILFPSLTVSLPSAFLTMLGKQWFNRYAPTDIRGSAVERSQNRQQKLDDIVNWYFDHVMGSLPLMLQAALLLLCCALSFLFIVAGVLSENYTDMNPVIVADCSNVFVSCKVSAITTLVGAARMGVFQMFPPYPG